MRPNTIRRLIELVEDSQIDVLEVTSWWRRVKITRKHPPLNGNGQVYTERGFSEQQMYVTAAPAPAPPAPPVAPQTAPAPAPAAPDTSSLVEIKSPMVGTFYSAPSPDSPAFVKVGDSVDVGTVVCIVEAMKLMNEIESEAKGKIAKILVENGQPVEFGQPLFVIE
ncbi:MAG TPA: acetyl-CoA carboxylase biotin carboxyl carrier protein [candidate division Zixibacteria bacterium]|nr:acetyl-CoA carboxylase biotin carboxyl carrier protein [candidate division Zixibacteria bacterium]